MKGVMKDQCRNMHQLAYNSLFCMWILLYYREALRLVTMDSAVNRDTTPVAYAGNAEKGSMKERNSCE